GGGGRGGGSAEGGREGGRRGGAWEGGVAAPGGYPRRPPPVSPSGRTGRARNRQISARPSRPARQPHRHARLQAAYGADGIEPQPEAVEVMVAHRARRPPGREFAERSQLRHARCDLLAVTGAEPYLASHRQTSQRIFAHGEGEPLLVPYLKGEHGLADRDDLTQLGDQDADRAVDRCDEPQLVELGL